MQDPHRFVNELDQAIHEQLIARLESRAQNSIFANLFDKYAGELYLNPSLKILEVGCGTGVILRSLVHQYNFSGEAYGVDQCHSFIEAAKKFSKTERISDLLTFQVGDIHCLDFEDQSFDLVIAHTVLSHVTEPAKVLSEMARVVRDDGVIVVFDGDYTSLTYACPDHSFGRQMDAALTNNTFNNPRIMPDLPRLLPGFGLTLTGAWGDAVVEIGKGNYFKTFAETYAPYLKSAGLMTSQAVDIWLNEQRKAMENGTFFAACNYYTFFIQRS
ncbi:MAG: methyltransferase domain-containing protein [Chromatiales bacterium]|jgi:SAM-dependent methyltransferase